MFSHRSRNATGFIEVKNSLYGSSASMKDKVESQEASGTDPSTVKNDSGTPNKKSNFLN